MPHCCKLSSQKKPCSCQEKLPESFVPGPLDVICARGKLAKSHPGNQRYQKIIEGYMERYVAATSKLQKMSIISEIVTKVRIASPDGGFVKLKESGWYEVGDHFAREKVSQSLRDNLHVLYRSSCKSKTIRRAVRRREEEDKQKQVDGVVSGHQAYHSLDRKGLLVNGTNPIPATIPASHLHKACLSVLAATPGVALRQGHLLPSSAAVFLSAPTLRQKTDAELMVARILLAQAQKASFI